MSEALHYYGRTRRWFFVPGCNTDVCVSCGKCLRACPAKKTFAGKIPLESYVAYHNDDQIRQKSSSGGVFYELAKWVLDKNGVVFGVVFDRDWCPKHVSAECMEDVLPMLGSKYVQSDTTNTFNECLSYLNTRELKFCIFALANHIFINCYYGAR